MSDRAGTSQFHILGQGLAGTAVAWQLRWRDRPFTIHDRGDPVTASSIAAGIINPVTGKRLAVDEHFDSHFATAEEFYRRVEAETNSRFFHPCDIVRLPRDDEERQKLLNMTDRARPAAVDLEQFAAPFGSFAVAAARLDVPAYLATSRRAFGPAFHLGTVEDSDDVVVIDCTGIAALRERRLAAELFQPAKGEILTLRIPGLCEDRIMLHSVWLLRVGEDLYRAGATYSWEPLDDVPSAVGRDEIVTRVRAFLKLPFKVVGHDAATRPIAVDRQPILRQLTPRRWAFNGLGSKGALLAPAWSERLAALLTK